MSAANGKKPRYVKTQIQLSKSIVPVYAGLKVAHALHEVTATMDLYHGVRLTQLLEAVYKQGKKDGARNVSESFKKMMKAIPHNNPGQPKKKK
jgi:hypothetical protein